ncbi:MAG: ATPase [Candidatus Moranbacteria bacterium RBG_13_45_13]|nr:MAG: ATPase [Candidatus Moranbacteria bacterium RBG_13_45_13]
MYPRKIYSQLEKHLKVPQITVLTGMRRTGKTTAIKYLMEKTASKNKLYLDLERSDNREIFTPKNYDIILENFVQLGLEKKRKAYVFLDEIQLVKNIPSILKYLYDTYGIKFVVTGSSSYYLKNLFSESLAGRKKIFELYPLDFSEFLTFREVAHKDGDFVSNVFNPASYARLGGYYEEYIVYGGFPKVVLTAGAARKKDLLRDIIDSYVSIDIKTLSDFRDLDNVYKLLKMLSGRVGTKLDYAKLSRLSGLSRETVLNYVDFFEKTYVLARIPVFAKSPDREIVKAQKLYFCDNGLLGILSDLDSGSKFENAAFCQLRSQGTIQYYSLKSGREIDFVLDQKTGLEVKEMPLDIDRKKLGALCQKAGLSEGRLIGRFSTPNFSDYIWGGDIR